MIKSMLESKIMLFLTLTIFTLPPTISANSSAERMCEDNVQGRVAWNYSGNTLWFDANLKRLCKGTTRAEEPGNCFNKVMHRRVGGIKWEWESVLDLCKGTSDAKTTILCFERKIKQKESQKSAIKSCTRPQLLAAVIKPIVITPTAIENASPKESVSPSGPSSENGNIIRTILSNGHVELVYPDGRRVQYYKGGSKTILPDGTFFITLNSTAARPATPPGQPNSAQALWLNTHSQRLLDVISTLVDSEQAVNNYLEFEGKIGVYEQIVSREQTISFLLK